MPTFKEYLQTLDIDQLKEQAIKVIGHIETRDELVELLKRRGMSECHDEFIKWYKANTPKRKVPDENLAKTIDFFIKQFAKLSPNFEPDENDPDCIDGKYTAPDTYELIVASERIRNGDPLIKFPWSEYSSGAYTRNKVSETMHDNIIISIKEYMKTHI